MVLLAKRLMDITTDDIVQALPIFFISCIVICIICWMIVKKKESENEAFPVEEGEVVCVDIRYMNSTVGSLLSSIMFETEEGRRVRIAQGVPLSVDYIVGDRGYLKWQGTKLISFARGKTKEDIDREKAEKAESEKNYDRNRFWKCDNCGTLNLKHWEKCDTCGRKRTEINKN